jgi:hypothetical protein
MPVPTPPPDPPAIVQTIEEGADAQRQAAEEAARIQRELEQATASSGQPTTSQPK